MGIITTSSNGRLCNQIIRNLAVSLIAEKFNLKVIYSSHEKINGLGIYLFSGQNSYEQMVNLSDDNYFGIYNSIFYNKSLDANEHYFQTREISKLLYHYINTECKTSIINKNPFNNRYNNNNDIGIHIRLTDARQFSPGIAYFKKAINLVADYDKMSIFTDEPNHKIVSELLNLYPRSSIFLGNEIETIQNASTCKNVILSHGSFSTVIGYLSFFSNVYYADFSYIDFMWFGDTFSIDSWIKVNKDI